MYRLIYLFVFSLLGSLWAQQAPRIEVDLEGPVFPWNHLEVNNSPETFQFAIVTDRTGGLRPGIFPDAIQKLNLLQPEFVMSVGDLISGYTTDTAELERQWNEFTGFIDKLQMPFFYLPGNHDITNPLMAEIWKEKFGASYYSFLFQDVLFLCLNSEDQARGAGKGTISQPQYEWVEQVLAEHSEVKWTLVFMHQPLWNQDNPEKWPEVEQLLASRKHTVFVGHNHRYVRYERNNGKYFVLATTGGGTRMRGPRFGEFDHVVWVTMTDDGPIMANLTLDGIWDEAVVTEEYKATFHGLSQQDPLQIEPILVREGDFSEGESTFRLTNESDFPMAVDIQGTANSELWAALDPIWDTLAPNTTRLIPVPVRSNSAVSPKQLPPLNFEAAYTYLGTDQPAFRVEAQYRFRPEREFGLSAAGKPVRLDGSLSEWPKLRFQSDDEGHIQADKFSHQGPKDGSFSFDLNYDEQALYMAIRVRDDQVEALDEERPTRQDFIGISLDARPVNIASNGKLRTGEGLIISASPAEENNAPANVYRAESLPDGIEVKSRRTASGYEIEVAIPNAVLNEFQGQSWEHIRVNVGMQDEDQQGGHVSRIYWQPDWRGKESRIGSGIFRKE